MSTPKNKMDMARELIKNKDYDVARAILKTVDHPTAAAWIIKIDEISPPKRASTAPAILLAVLGIVVVCLLLAGIVYTQREKIPAVAALFASPTPTITPSPTATFTFTPTYTFTPTDTPTVTNTPTTTLTPSITPTFTPLPTQTLKPTTQGLPGEISDSQAADLWFACGFPSPTDDPKGADQFLHAFAESALINDWERVGKVIDIYASKCKPEQAFQFAWHLIFRLKGGTKVSYVIDRQAEWDEFYYGWYH